MRDIPPPDTNMGLIYHEMEISSTVNYKKGQFVDTTSPIGLLTVLRIESELMFGGVMTDGSACPGTPFCPLIIGNNQKSVFIKNGI